MAIRMSGFGGEVPRFSPRFLPANNAQLAVNTKLQNGSISPIRSPHPVGTLPDDTLTIFRYNDAWLGWDVRVDVVPAPIAEDRLYITGDGVPKIRYGGITYQLKVPRPASAPTATLGAGTVDPDLQKTHLYVYTYVTPLDEESEPSDPSNEVLRSPGIDVILTGILAPPAGRPIDRVRIYRSETSALGTTNLFFVHELAAGSVGWTDDIEENPIQEALGSTTYNPPPDDLSGLISLPNGMMAGFSGKKLYFSEPFLPHAWPEAYVLTTDYVIVALGSFGSTIAVMTEGTPYVVQGTTPDSMVMEKTELDLPCISKPGVVDMGYAILYPSTRGLVSVSNGGAVLATEQLFTRDQWLAMEPATFVASRWDDNYLATYTFTNELDVEVSATIIVNMGSQTPAFVSRSGIVGVAMFTEIGTGKLFMFVDGAIYEWDSPDEEAAPYRWRSKLNILPGQTNYGTIYLEDDGADFRPGVTSTLSMTASVYADGVLIGTTTKVNEPDRLPGGRLALSWEVEVYGTRTISSITLAGGPGELQG